MIKYVTVNFLPEPQFASQAPVASLQHTLGKHDKVCIFSNKFLAKILKYNCKQSLTRSSSKQEQQAAGELSVKKTFH